MVKGPNGKERNDEYYWLRDDDRVDQEVLDYLKVSGVLWLKSEAHTFTCKTM